jgi:hypothetical protein
MFKRLLQRKRNSKKFYLEKQESPPGDFSRAGDLILAYFLNKYLRAV